MPRLGDVSLWRVKGGEFLPCCDHEETLAGLGQAELRHVLDTIADVVACGTDVSEEHVEVGLMLSVRV